MHISIPDGEELAETKSSRSGQTLRYVSYNIHINGTYHCSARYSTLRALDAALRREFGNGCLETFPPKTFFYLKPEQAIERRLLLQRWLQKISQQPNIVGGETFQNFLLNAQKEVQRGPEEEAQLEVFLVNGKSVKVDIISTDQSDDVLETVCSLLGLASDLTYFFSLFLVDDLDGKVIVRRLQEFESPYISLMRAEPHQKIQLRRAYWDTSNEKHLTQDVALNLVYIQALQDIKNGLVEVDDASHGKLEDFRQQKDRASFLKVARKLKGYGWISFGDAVLDYPQDGTKGDIFIGNGDLICVHEDGSEDVFLIQHMRCWRTYTVDEGIELEFEYFFPAAPGEAKGSMKWVKVFAQQTIHLAMSLQFVVQEMLRLRNHKGVKKPSDREGAFKPRRQSNKPADLSFLTTDATSASESVVSDDGTDEDGDAVASPAAPAKVAVTLSGLLANLNKDKSDDDDDDAEHDSDDYVSDDDTNGFSSIAGL